MTIWILIIVLHGWGSGVGSTGNAVGSVEFSTQQKCETAAAMVSKKISDKTDNDAIQVMCVEK